MRRLIGRHDGILTAGPIDVQYDKEPPDYLGTWADELSIGIHIGPYAIRLQLIVSRTREKSLARGRKVGL